MTVGEERFDVTGLAWKDHEWSTSALSEGAIGWDWISLQMDDGGALMLFEIRRADGTREPLSAGTYVAPDGTLTHLAAGDWTLEVTDTWASPNSCLLYTSRRDRFHRPILQPHAVRLGRGPGQPGRAAAEALGGVEGVGGDVADGEVGQIDLLRPPVRGLIRRLGRFGRFRRVS